MSIEIAKELLTIKAVFLSPSEPFTWASGIRSPIYCDNRLILSYPETRTKVEKALAELVKKQYPKVEVIMGTSTAGIAHAAIVADILALPMGYVRSTEKDHGRKNAIEGKLTKGSKVVVIEDLISTAGSVVRVVETIRENGGIVLGIASIFTYELDKGLQTLKNSDVENVSLSNFSELVEAAQAMGYISTIEAKKCITFQRNPQSSDWISLK